jgi:hypothetical protein
MTSAADDQRFFGRLADEVADACDDGRLRCVSPGFASMPPLARIDEARIVSSLHRATTYLFSFDLAEPSGLPRTSGTEEEWDAMIAPLRGVDGTLADHQTAERRAADRQQAVSGLTDVYRVGGAPGRGAGACRLRRGASTHGPAISLADARPRRGPGRRGRESRAPARSHRHDVVARREAGDVHPAGRRVPAGSARPRVVDAGLGRA